MHIDKIIKFVYYLAHRAKDDNTPLMDFDEIVGELLLEIVKGLDHYDDGARTEGELLAILRKMCDNRVAELRQKYYRTHRVAAITAVSVEGLAECDNDSGGIYPRDLLSENTPPVMSSSTMRVVETRNRLSPFSKQVFDAVILRDDQRVATQIRLAGMRASAVFKNATVRIKPRHVAEALVEDEKKVREAFKEIKAMYAEVCKEYG